MKGYIRTIALVTALVCAIITDTQAAGRYRQPVNYDQQASSAWSFEPASSYYAVRIGFTVPQLFLDTHLDPSRHPQLGMALGFSYGAQLTDDYPLFLEPGLYYTTLGHTINSNLNPANYQKKMSIRMHKLEIPVVFKYRIETMFDDLTVDPFFGGFFSVGIAGKTKYFNDSYDPTRSKENTYRSTAFKAFEAGLRLGCGVTYQQLYAEAAYDIGLTNIANSNMTDFGYDNFDDSVRSGCFYLSVGVMF